MLLLSDIRNMNWTFLYWMDGWTDGRKDLHWVQALTVPMHLGLIDRPFVPHNQESPVHLPKFQMAPGFKILMSSGSKIGTQI